MWFVKSWFGFICVFLTYVIIAAVDSSIIFLAIWRELKKGETAAIIHAVLGQVITGIIIWCHLKCMLTDPGCLDKNQGDQIDKDLLSQEAQTLYATIQDANDAGGDSDGVRRR